jgi:hypothetical protein
MNQNSHIHTPDDGRGIRDVFVNGIKVDGVCWADTMRGMVVYYPEPVRVKKNSDRVYSRKLRGHVEVVARQED